jgi:Methyltransferase FkbM domain
VLSEATLSWDPIRECLHIKTRRLANILDEHAVLHDFDVLSIDIEGIDRPVLLDLLQTTPYRPTWIIIKLPHGDVVRLTSSGWRMSACRS